MTVKFYLIPGVRNRKFYLALGMRNEKIYLVPNDSYEKLYFAVKGLIIDKVESNSDKINCPLPSLAKTRLAMSDRRLVDNCGVRRQSACNITIHQTLLAAIHRHAVGQQARRCGNLQLGLCNHRSVGWPDQSANHKTC